MTHLHRSHKAASISFALAAAGALLPAGAEAQSMYWTRRPGYVSGVWGANRSFYLPQFGFGMAGPSSWYYGRPGGYGSLVVIPSVPSGNLTVTHLGNQRLVSFQPYSLFDTSQVGGETFYRLSPFGLTQLGGRGLLDPAVVETWSAATLPAVHLNVTPGNATLSLDGNPIGAASSFRRPGAELRLPPGRYLLEAAARGRIPAATEIDAREGDRLTWTQKLEPLKPTAAKANRRPVPRARAVRKAAKVRARVAAPRSKRPL